MRVLLAFIVALGAPVAAHAADEASSLRALSWSAKREVVSTVPETPAAQRPEPMALSGQYLRGRVEAPQEAAPPELPGRFRAAAPPPYKPFTPQIPLPMQQQAVRTASLPASLYSSPAAQPAAPQAQTQPSSVLRPATSPLPPAPLAAAPQAAPPQVQPAPMRMAAAPAPLPASPRTAGEPSRLYSVHRDYGMAPDAIPEPPAGSNRYVLIGPPDGVAATAPQDDENDDDQNDRQPAF